MSPHPNRIAENDRRALYPVQSWSTYLPTYLLPTYLPAVIILPAKSAVLHTIPSR